MAIIKPVILEGGQLKTAGVGDQVPQSFVEGLESSLESRASKTELTTGLDRKVDKVTGKGLSDTNFTQVEKDKLSGVAEAATKNRADSKNADKVHNHPVEQVSGLGTAATRNVGESAGQVMEVGAFGTGQWRDLRSKTYTPASVIGRGTSFGFASSLSAGFGGSKTVYGSVMINGQYSDVSGEAGSANMMFLGANQILYKWQIGGNWEAHVALHHSGNTTKGPDGSLKGSSPVINLYTDNHDLHNESQFGATPSVARKSKGVYEITGTLGLRSEGWYLDTPSDRNGNKYFNIEWTQDITPDAVDGVVDEYRDDIVVTIETFERVWNKDTGMFENGAPVDINDSQARFVQLRFNELKVEHEVANDASN